MISDPEDGEPLRCFVISPIGQTGTAPREHADDVFDYIIRPAMEIVQRRRGVRIEPSRGDHSAAPGKISEQIFASILNDDLIVTVLSGHNPNVFYELAVAQAAARPCVLMIESSESIPFDIKDIRAVIYDLKPRNLMTDVHAERLADAVCALLDSDEPESVPFGRDLEPLGRGDADVAIFDSYHEIRFEQRLAALEDAAEFIRIKGVAQLAIPRHPDTIEILKKKKAQGCTIQVLLMDPDCPALEWMMPGHARGSIETVSAEAWTGAEEWAVMRRDNELDNVQIRQFAKGVMYSNAIVTDQVAIITPYLYSRNTADSPTVRVRSGSSIHRTIQGEFDHIWRLSADKAIPYEGPDRQADKPKRRRRAANGAGARTQAAAGRKPPSPRGGRARSGRP